LLDIFCEKVAVKHHFYTAPPPGKNFKRIFNFVLPVHFEAWVQDKVSIRIRTKIHRSGSRGPKPTDPANPGPAPQHGNLK
jgi:hypothetical protein